MSEYKVQYTKEEVDELIQWFEDRKESLPKTAKIGDYVSIDDLPTTLKALEYNARRNRENVVFSGLIHQLFLLRDELMKSMEGKA
jgi:hypothetical protein